ncbi:MAG: hypothetical protein EA380_11710 [Phycisphaeraceae bacterium]|nr:MAG: hypothetical protein EA380_11710 [Phycisphaeraceae bacterium]
MSNRKRAIIRVGMACAVIGSAGMFSCASPVASSSDAETKMAEQQHADLRALLLSDRAVTPDDLANLADHPDCYSRLRVSPMSEADFASIPDADRRDDLLRTELELTNRVRQLARETRDEAILAAESGDHERFDRYVWAIQVLADANLDEESLMVYRIMGIAILRLVPEDTDLDR